jgi:hypothetical protein
MYDYNEPNAVDDDLKARFELIVVDPPYLVCPAAPLCRWEA